VHTDPVNEGTRATSAGPLETAELEVVRRYLPGLQLRHFAFLARFSRFLLPPGNDYEAASVWQRRAMDTLAGVDWAVLTAPPLAPLGGMAVLWATPPQP
jgi:hypothetical protein